MLDVELPLYDHLDLAALLLIFVGALARWPQSEASDKLQLTPRWHRKLLHFVLEGLQHL